MFNVLFKRLIILSLILNTLPVFSQTNLLGIAQGAEDQFEQLLNKPAMVSPPTAVPLGRNWFTLKTDVHVFTDRISTSQVAAVMLDIENQGKYFNGRRSKLTTHIIGHTADETIVDNISITVIGPFHIRTPFRSVVKTMINTYALFALETRQTPEDSASNNKIKNFYAPRYVEEVSINGRKYTYIRMLTIQDINASFLPGAKRSLERNATPVIDEVMQMLINAEKK